MGVRRLVAAATPPAAHALLAGAILAACGFDGIGTGPTGGGAAPPSEDASAATDGSPGVDGGHGYVDGSVEGSVPDAAVADATTDAAPGDVVTVSSAPATGNVDLTAEGTLDWAHWGVTAGTTPVRRAGVNLIGDYSVTGTGLVTGSNGGAGWPIFAKWTNGDATRPTEMGTDTYRYFTGSSDTSIRWSVPAAPTTRQLAVYVAVGQAKARVTATLTGTNKTASIDIDTGAGANKFVRVAIDYASPLPNASVKVTLAMLMRYSLSVESALSFGSATLH